MVDARNISVLSNAKVTLALPDMTNGTDLLEHAFLALKKNISKQPGRHEAPLLAEELLTVGGC